MTTSALVHVIDDDPAIRDSVKYLLASVDIDSVGYSSASAFLAASSTMRPGCIVMDLRIPDMSGLELQSLCAERSEHKPILFLTGYGDVEVSVRAMQQGAIEFLTKPVNDEVLLQKIRDAIALNRRQQAEFNQQATLRARLDLLSPREAEVLTAVVDGYSNKEIARRLAISHKTVELHRSHVMEKMHAGSLAELVRIYMQVSLAKPAPSTS